MTLINTLDYSHNCLDGTHSRDAPALGQNGLGQMDIGKFLMFLGAAGVIVTGIVSSDGELFFRGPRSLVGLALFLGGWAMIAKLLYDHDGCHQDTIVSIPVVAAFTIAGCIVTAAYLSRTDIAPQLFPSARWPLTLVFVTAWLILGWSVGGVQNSWKSLILSIGASLLACIAIILILPWQRRHGIVDGPGLPIFILAWVLLGVTVSSG